MPKIPVYRFGKNAVILAAAIAATAIAADGTVTKPATADFKVFCLPSSVEIGVSNSTVPIENFCTGGQTVNVRDGGQEGTMTIGESTWSEGDPVLDVFEAAAFADTPEGGWVYISVAPLGVGVGKPVYDLIIDVRAWTMTIPSKGVITVGHELAVLEGPIPGTQAA